MPIVECKVCQGKFYAKPRHIKIGWGKYCTVKCRTQAQFNGKLYKCDNCQKEIYRTPASIKRSSSGKFFCSRSCHCVWENKYNRIIEKSPYWRSGINVYRQIMERSNLPKKCNSCGLKDDRVLEVHHKDNNRKNNNINNLIWLCCNCHRLEHNKTKKHMVAFV